MGTLLTVVPPVAPSTRKKREDGCWNCAWGSRLVGNDRILCEVDLPPMLNVTSDPKRHTAHENYMCAFHKKKG